MRHPGSSWPPIWGLGLMQTCPGRVSGFWLRKGQREGLFLHLRPGGPPEQLSAGRLTGAGVVHVPVVHQYFVEQDHAGITGEGLPSEPRREGHERRRWSPWGGQDALAVRPSPGLCAVPRGGLSLSFPLRVDTLGAQPHPRWSRRLWECLGRCVRWGLGACMMSGGGAPRAPHPGLPSHPCCPG